MQLVCQLANWSSADFFKVNLKKQQNFFRIPLVAPPVQPVQ